MLKFHVVILLLIITLSTSELILTQEVILKFLSPIVKLIREHFHLLLVMSTVGMPCLTQLDVLHHSALLSVYCVHVLVILHRFYVLNVILIMLFVYSGYSKCLLTAW